MIHREFMMNSILSDSEPISKQKRLCKITSGLDAQVLLSQKWEAMNKQLGKTPGV